MLTKNQIQGLSPFVSGTSKSARPVSFPVRSDRNIVRVIDEEKSTVTIQSVTNLVP